MSGAAGVDPATVAALRRSVADRLETSRQPEGNGQDGVLGQDEQARAEWLVTEEVARWVRRRAETGAPPVTAEAEQRLARAVLASLTGLGILAELLAREDVENVHVHGNDQVWLELADGRLERSPYPVAESDTALVERLASIFARLGQTSREFSPAQPMGNLRIPAGGPLGARLSAVTHIVDRPRVAIRRHRLTATTLTDLTRHGTLTPDLAALLTAAVRAGCNLLVTGGPAAGKTTLLRALCRDIPLTEHVVTVEDEHELGLHLDTGLHLVTPLEARLANAEGAGQITLDDLLKQALRHSPRRVIVGEVRAGEVAAMLRALGNGAAGGMCTLHARTAEVVFDRIASLGMLASPPLPAEAAYSWTASAIDLVVHIARIDDTDHQGRSRRRRLVTDVLEVGPIGETGRPDITRLYSHGDVRPVFPPSPQLRHRLAAAGHTPRPAPTVGPRRDGLDGRAAGRFDDASTP